VENLYLETFGCQMNVHDSEKVAGTLMARGYTQWRRPKTRTVLYNTCSIRDKAEQKVIQPFAAVQARRRQGKVSACWVAWPAGRRGNLPRAPHVSLVAAPPATPTGTMLVQLESGNRRVTG